MDNLTLKSDSYKWGHADMLPEGTTYIHSYCEARTGGEYPNMVFYGLQGIIREHLCTPITQDDVNEMRVIAKSHLGTDDLEVIRGFQTMVDENLGYPVRIRAVAEGTIVPEGNVLFTIENTDDRFPWATNFIESILMKVYYPSIVATRSHETMQVIEMYFGETSDLPSILAKHLFHDFGYRSCHSEESAALGGSAHLLSSVGTDTISALKYACDYYGAEYDTLAYSVPATEHSVSTLYGLSVEEEINYVDTMITRFPNGVVSLVADTKDTLRFVDKAIRTLKDKIVARHENGTAPLNRVVIRPDSPLFEGEQPYDQVLTLFSMLDDIFGHTVNSRGYKVLHPAIGLLYGDGLSSKQIEEIYYWLAREGWSVESMVVGQGGGLVVKNIDRDTNRFAIKASLAIINDVEREVRKIPKDVTKASKGGRLSLIKEMGQFRTIKQGDEYGHYVGVDHKDYLETVYENGEMKKFQSFNDIRENLEKQ